MKYFVLLPDGAADYKVPELDNRTPLMAANIPTIDMLASKSLCGTVSNVPEGMVPESDTANLAVLSYDPKEYSKGRSPLEALSMGLTMREDQTAVRCNVVTLEGDGNYEDLIITDHSADEITTEEADALIKTIDEKLGDQYMSFYTGVSYRHCLLWKDMPAHPEFMRPHDILGKRIGDYLPPKPFRNLMELSWEILKNHPINLARIERGLRPANSIWLWSPGKKPALPLFKDKWGLNGVMISAVDLMKGIGICAGMKSIDVEGATGNVKTNFTGKADAAINAFKDGADFVYVHVEAPDECGHRAEIENKVKSMELIDEKILKPVYEYLKSTGEDYGIMLLPDHPTPLCMRTHAMDPVPFMIYLSNDEKNGVSEFNEDTCKAAGLYLDHGYDLLSHMIKK